MLVSNEGVFAIAGHRTTRARCGQGVLRHLRPVSDVEYVQIRRGQCVDESVINRAGLDGRRRRLIQRRLPDRPARVRKQRDLIAVVVVVVEKRRALIVARNVDHGGRSTHIGQFDAENLRAGVTVVNLGVARTVHRPAEDDDRGRKSKCGI